MTDRWAHQTAKAVYTEDDWCVMYGPKPGNSSQEHAFIHHACEKRDLEGRLRWKSWYVTRKQWINAWCDYCGSEPSDELQALSIMLETK